MNGVVEIAFPTVHNDGIATRRPPLLLLTLRW